MDQIKFGKFISSLRIESGLTQEQLAEKLNISSKTISKWECGNSMPDFETIIELSKIFNITLYELSTCEKINKKNIKKEEILKVVNKKHLKTISRKKKITFLLTFIIIILAILSMLYAGYNYNTTKIHTLESLNNEFKVVGTYTKTKDYSIFALTKIGYTGNNTNLLNYIIDNYDYELLYNNRKVYNHNQTKVLTHDSEITIREALSQVSILIDNKTHNVSDMENDKLLTLIISYKDKNNILSKTTIKIKLIENYVNNKIW